MGVDGLHLGDQVKYAGELGLGGFGVLRGEFDAGKSRNATNFVQRKRHDKRAKTR